MAPWRRWRERVAAFVEHGRAQLVVGIAIGAFAGWLVAAHGDVKGAVLRVVSRR